MVASAGVLAVVGLAFTAVVVGGLAAVTRTYAKMIADTDAVPLDQMRRAIAKDRRWQPDGCMRRGTRVRWATKRLHI